MDVERTQLEGLIRQTYMEGLAEHDTLCLALARFLRGGPAFIGWALWNSVATLAAAPPLLRIEQHCLRCGCTDQWACPEGCWWATPYLCSSCADKGDVRASAMRQDARPARLLGPARYHTCTRTKPALHPWAPLCGPAEA